MKRHIAWLLSCGILVGCGATPPPIDEPSAPTPAQNQNDSDPAPSTSSPSDAAHAPAAFHFKSGVLEIGDFDPYTLGDNIFDPCTEISPEEFAAAGFDNVEPLPEEYAGLAKGLSACEARNEEGLIELSFMNNDADRHFIEETTHLIDLEDLRSALGAFAYGPQGDGGSDCYVQIDTHRGGFVAVAPGLPGLDNQYTNCVKALRSLEALFDTFGAAQIRN